MKSKNAEKIKLTLTRSISGRAEKHKRTLECLGLRRINQSVSVSDNPAMRGMIQQVSYLLKVESN